ncbi:DUF6924 domain-containing protein [Pseudonocardia sp. HH130630-07]|uniref:DUF6924 domain-containing protein n=1 Tax=Pseudonocardia sp. HH130630-07 TaxID=1690815 RepID=UPI000814B6E3|nr:hypothetical protein [Pseudonocardia sp. HH130630-07]ANY05751.1 hypothetical protein AFB00_04885 [Pseudonocardia sp. HH130630-07]
MDQPDRRLHDTFGVPLIRTSFDDESAWQRCVDIVTTPLESDELGVSFQGAITMIDDRSFTASPVEALAVLARRDTPQRRFLFVYDKQSETADGDVSSLLAVDLSTEQYDRFRLAAPEIHLVENNLSGFNMDFREFRQAAERDASGVYRGFSD